jgi:[acyl-carrier-protein] S-malonyltransferase
MIAFVFPGQGSQTVGMGRALAEAFPICRETFEEADAALGFALGATIFEGPADRLTLTEIRSPISGDVARGAAQSRGCPAIVAATGRSAHRAGTFSFADAVRTVHHRTPCGKPCRWVRRHGRHPRRRRALRTGSPRPLAARS